MSSHQPLPQSDGGAAAGSTGGRVGLLVAGGLLVAVGVAIGAGGVMYAEESGALASPHAAAAPPALAMADLPEDEADDGQGSQCGSDASFDWQAMSVTVPAVGTAMEKAFMLLNAAREECEGGGFPELPFGASAFEKGVNHTHYVHAHHKFASTCKGETFKLHFFMDSSPGTPEKDKTSFVAQVHREFESGSWTLLHSSPMPCEINTGEAAYPESVPPNTPSVQKLGKFVASELSFQMKMAKCLAHDKTIEVTKIESARSEVAAGLETELVLFLKEKGSKDDAVKAEVTVVEECDLTQSGQCVNELQLGPEYDGDVCAIFSQPSAPGLRRLEEDRGLGHVPPDPTEMYVARDPLFRPRSLRAAAAKPPLMQRYMKGAPAPPASWDLRDHECFRKITVYDQGSCGSCYAQAVAQMMGIRKCLLDKGASHGRRLMEKLPAPGGVVSLVENRSSAAGRALNASATETKLGCKCKKSWSVSGPGGSCDNYCCNPDESMGDWCFVESEGCQGRNWGYCKETVEQPECKDNALWADVSNDSCEWYSKHDKGCKQYKDYGQRTHCKVTCGTCPSVQDESSDANPWHGALYKYMPSVEDVAQCARDKSGQPNGCDGGNTHVVWNNWMRHSQRGLHVMGQSCLPYKLKCWKSSGVVNPLSGGACGAYKGYELWHKPCSCIPHTMYPRQYQCPADSPSSDCDFPVLPLAFTVANMAHGLSNAEAVKNMQQHIHEYGPIYVSFATTQGFMQWDWESRPVYTGGGQPRGGHAVTAVGWGTDSGTDYWLIRNSWGSGWADKGYCKFQRGINLDQIEESEATAIMPEANAKDYSPPSCRIARTKSAWSYLGSRLSVYTMKLFVACDKAASVELFYSNRIAPGAPETGSFSGNVDKFEAKGKLTTRDLELICSGFGLARGGMMVKLTATDASGNVGNSQFVLNVGAPTGMLTVDNSGCGR